MFVLKNVTYKGHQCKAFLPKEVAESFGDEEDMNNPDIRLFLDALYPEWHETVETALDTALKYRSY